MLGALLDVLAESYSSPAADQAVDFTFEEVEQDNFSFRAREVLAGRRTARPTRA